MIPVPESIQNGAPNGESAALRREHLIRDAKGDVTPVSGAIRRTRSMPKRLLQKIQSKRVESNIEFNRIQLKSGIEIEIGSNPIESNRFQPKNSDRNRNRNRNELESHRSQIESDRVTSNRKQIEIK